MLNKLNSVIFNLRKIINVMKIIKFNVISNDGVDLVLKSSSESFNLKII